MTLFGGCNWIAHEYTFTVPIKEDIDVDEWRLGACKLPIFYEDI